MAGLPLKLHRLTVHDKSLFSVIASRIVPVPFSLHGEWEFLFLPPRPNVSYKPGIDDNWVVDFFWGKGVFSLVVPDTIFCLFLEDWLGDKTIHISSLDHTILVAVVDAVVDNVIESISRLGVGSVRLNSVTRLPKGDLPKLSCEGRWLKASMNRLNGREEHDLWLHVDEGGSQFLQKVLSMLPHSGGGVKPEEVPVVSRFLLGSTTLLAKEFKQLENNDVILFDECYLKDNILLVCVGECMGFRALWKDNQLIVQTKLGMIMGQKFDDDLDDFWDDDDTTLMSDDDDDDEIDFDDDDDEEEDDDDSISKSLISRSPSLPSLESSAPKIGSQVKSAPDTGNLPVHLTFDLGEKHLKFKDLSAISPGYVFDLGRPLNSAISIRANRKIIADGELVDIDGHLGVSVTSLKN
ncbi:type III secretion system cytoplasmic ring protein SctQ [Candidatus Ichthyocystis sparus]|nr:type III secretion system cytoplasmic ring protein SctQ [Candidatus Ichthyocystis sparus]